jgi:hypothetical protein
MRSAPILLKQLVIETVVLPLQRKGKSKAKGRVVPVLN